MTTFAFAHIKQTTFNNELIEYIQRIDATLEPYHGRFRIHGGSIERVEGGWQGEIILIEFPDSSSARAWYHSAPYQQIASLRIANSSVDVIFVEGVSSNHKAADILKQA